MTDKNNFFSKIKRQITCFFPVDKKRTGKCISCGKCCKLPNQCVMLRSDKKGDSYCAVYKIRPLSCRVYPRTEQEHITNQSCGFRFKK